MSNNHSISKLSIIKISLLWTPLFLWYAIIFFFPHSQAIFHKVDSIYYDATRHWLYQQFIYTGVGNGRFVYFPTTTALFSPLALFSLKTFEILFRILSAVFLSAGVYYFSISIATRDIKRVFFITLLCTIILSQAAFFQGQLHVMTTGVLLLGCAAIAREKWWQSALWFAFALALKPTSIVLYLLVITLYPKLTLRLLFYTAGFVALSFIAKSPHYVAAQYVAFVPSFLRDMRYDDVNPWQWATLFGAIAFYSHHLINGTPQFLIRIFAALFVFAMCLYVKIKCTKKEVVYFIFTLGMCYLMLFNSRTENNDYIMVAPAIGYWLSIAIHQKKYIEIYGISIAIFLLAINWELSKWLTPLNNVWLPPSIIFIYFIYMLRIVIKSTATANNEKLS